MDDRMRAARIRLRDDFAFYAAKALKIRTKDGDLSPLVLNKAQSYFLIKIEEQLAARGFIRAIILKGRQQGLSTVVGARLMFRTSQHEATNALVVAHKADSTEALFEMTKLFYDELPPILRPATKYNAKKELSFSELKSAYSVSTAGGTGIARGKTLRLVHLSEVAFWSPTTAKTNFNGLIKAVPNSPGTEVYIESTANGVTGLFAETWREAVAGRNGWLPIFIPWYWQDEYREDVPENFERSPGEQDLVDLHGLDDAQLVWRRSQVALSGLDLFRQEYPCTPDEAFLTTGSPVFNPEQISDLLRIKRDEPKRMSLKIADNEFEEDPRGDLAVYEEPKISDIYSIGADVAFGAKDGDYSVAQVLDGSKRLVATFRARIHPDMFADVLAALGHLYNSAEIACESNNHGLTTLTKLAREHRYPHVWTEVDIAKQDEQYSEKLGFQTTAKSKPPLIDNLREAMRDKSIHVPDRTTLEEMRSFIRTGERKLEAESGCYDDCVMALAIALHIHRPQGSSITEDLSEYEISFH